MAQGLQQHHQEPIVAFALAALTSIAVGDTVKLEIDLQLLEPLPSRGRPQPGPVKA